MARNGQRRTKTRCSLTLIEVLVVLLILGMVGAGSWWAWREGYATQRLRASAATLERKLALARALAMTKQQPTALRLSLHGNSLEGVLEGAERPRFRIHVQQCLWNGRPFDQLLITTDSRGDVYPSGVLTLQGGGVHAMEIRL